jgi:TonB-linked SusC/RagA family outer membrane protein
MRKLLLFSLLLLLIAARGYSQSKTITGVVLDKDANPLPAVTIVVIETQKATTTDTKGKFSIQAGIGQTINFSYLGFATQTVKVTAATTTVKVTMLSSDINLSEVVVTGYTAERKKDLTGAVTVVNVNDIKDIPEGNPMKALQGRVPGLTIFADGSPNGAVTVRLRGTTTLNDNDPLYIIDGIPSQRGLQEINQNDIESIQVLRDASAATIYGSRAAAGVIIITTKKGKNGAMRLDFDASTSLQYYNSKISALNTQQHGQAYWQAQVNDDQFGVNYIANGNNNTTNPNGKLVDPSVSNGIYTYNWNNNYANPVLNSVNIPTYVDAAKTMLSANTNWFNEISQPSILQAYNLSMSSGSENSHSLFSVGYYDDQGIIKETRDTKYNLRYNSDYSFFNGRLKIGQTLSTTYMRDPILPTGSITILSLIENPIIPVHTVDGVGWGGPVAGMDDRDNPVRLIEDNKQNVNSFGRVFGNAYLDLAILPQLHFKTTYAGDFAGNYFRSVQLPYVAGFLSDPRTIAAQSTDYAVTLTWQNQLTYDLNFGKSKMNFLVGEESIKDKFQNFNASAQGLALSNIDYAYLSAGTSNVTAAGAGSGDALQSYFAKVNYTYNDKYLLSATVRRDGSSKFGANNRYATFPAASVGWRLSQEDFIKKLTFISDLKIRYGYGQTGNQNIANNATYSLYQSIYGNAAPFSGDSGSAYDISGKGTGTLPSGFTSTQTGNPDLKWETTTQSNIGIDFGLFNNKITGSVDYFNKNTTDILISPPYLAVLGEGGNEYFNGALLNNKGIEAIVSYNTNVSKDVSIDITGNIAAYRNKAISIPQDVLTAYPGNGTTQTVIGRSINSEYGYVVQDIFSSAAEVANSATQPGKALGRIRYQDINGDGVIDQNDQQFLGSSDPNFTYGLNTAINYKHLSLSFFFQGVQGGLVYNSYKYLTDFTSLAPGSNWGTRTLNAWTPQNAGSTIPALTVVNTNDEGRYSSYFLESASYLKLRNIQLGYDMIGLLKKTKLKRAKVYIQASNLLKFKSSSYTGPDPENPGNAYPIPVITSIGVNFSY